MEPEVIPSVRDAVCAIGYLKMPVEQFLKDRQQAALEVMGFVIGYEVVLTCAHVFDDLADELR